MAEEIKKERNTRIKKKKKWENSLIAAISLRNEDNYSDKIEVWAVLW